MKLLQKQVQGLYATQTTTQLKIKDEWENWDYIDLGMICFGVKNNEGYAKVFLELGRDPKKVYNKKKYKGFEIARLTHKFYFSNTTSHHHQYRDYWEWTGNVYDYIKEIKKGLKNDKNRNKKGL